ncbi:MAG: hypothetical protein MRQ09_02155 [Candidatus Midichloria sp.]|nr:hypothetical protein [Candidatus Midichloria sp.]
MDRKLKETDLFLSLTTQTGFCIHDNAIRNAGTALGYVDDINGDGINDILGGAVNWNVEQPMHLYILASGIPITSINIPLEPTR